MWLDMWLTSVVHFDLIDHNVREYDTVADLRAILPQRLTAE